MQNRNNSVVKVCPNRRGLLFAEVAQFVTVNTDYDVDTFCLANALVPRKQYHGILN